MDNTWNNNFIPNSNNSLINLAMCTTEANYSESFSWSFIPKTKSPVKKSSTDNEVAWLDWHEAVMK